MNRHCSQRVKILSSSRFTTKTIQYKRVGCKRLLPLTGVYVDTNWKPLKSFIVSPWNGTMNTRCALVCRTFTVHICFRLSVQTLLTIRIQSSLDELLDESDDIISTSSLSLVWDLVSIPAWACPAVSDDAEVSSIPLCCCHVSDGGAVCCCDVGILWSVNDDLYFKSNSTKSD